MRLAGARFIDVVMVGCELSGAALTEAVLTRVEFRDCRLLGASFAQAQLRDVRFIDCRLDDSDFRMCTGERARFDHCSLVRGDFYAARLRHARLFDCDLTGAEFSQADFAGGRLHGSKLEALRGAKYLSGVTISSGQLLPMALQMLGLPWVWWRLPRLEHWFTCSVIAETREVTRPDIPAFS